MIETVNEEEVKKILRQKEEMIANIHKRMLILYNELHVSPGELLKEAAMPAVRTDGMPGAKGSHKDVGDLLISYQRQKNAREEEICEMMWVLSEREAAISRVWACFCALDDPYYSILEAIYVQNQLYQTVEKESGMSHKTFEKYRQHGIELIIRFYNSSDNISELMRRHNDTGKKKVKNAEEQTVKEYDQISILDLAADK